MIGLTKKQRAVLDFIRQSQQRLGHSPTLREICQHFGFKSPKAATDHVAALERKGFLEKDARRARTLRVITPLQKFLRPVAHVPIYGSIPAGFAEARQEEADGCVSLDLATLGRRSADKLFALRVRGDSMVGKHILDGDIAIIDGARAPRTGDVVAALIDGESTLKTLALERGKPILRAENPRYPALWPAEELKVQGVLVTLVRQQK